MDFSTIESLEENGFVGFQSISELQDPLGCSAITSEPNVYLVVRANAMEPEFLATGTGGHYKGRNPNVPVEELQAHWVPGAIVVYIGKATKLKKRIRQYVRFGQGQNGPHYDGRYIWQLSDSADLKVCWKSAAKVDPEAVERELLDAFKAQYGGKRPFANLTG
ncbi:MAG: hypothetical protein JW910_18810 [Anaerolineae bacterium]|nr:hypothetical protein [Anaerolineae bacterium]